MYDFHSHTLFSDGDLLPMELVQRYISKGYKGIAITDHVDYSNVDFVIESLFKAVQELKKSLKNFLVIPGVEITHVPPCSIEYLVRYVRDKKIKLILGHGETIVEPVIEGTNRTFIEAGVDILAHPGLIDISDVELAREKGVFLELTSRRGHCLTNGHVAKIAKQAGANLTINNDTHSPSDIVVYDRLKKVGIGSGLSMKEVEDIFKAKKQIIEKIS